MHAYLIMTHNNFGNLEILLKMLDDYRNDIYIHLDSKVKNFNFNKYKNLCKKSNLEFVERIDTRWGDISLVKAEIILLKKASKKNYEYYHLISGSDLPIKSQDYIHDFFKRNNGKEFIDFRLMDFEKKIFRIRGYHLTLWTKSSNNLLNLMDRCLNKILNILYLNFKLRRKNFEDYEIKYGSQWFSITNEFCKEIIKNEKNIKKKFFMTSCSDEYFMQTIIYNSEFRKKIFYEKDREDSLGCMRLIDWKKGNPYIFREEDFKDIISSDKLFARKFDENLDKEIIFKIFEYFSKNI